KQTRKLCRACRSAHLLLHSLVVVDRAIMRDQLVSKTMQNDELASAITEVGKVGVVCAKRRIKKFGGLLHQQLEFGGGQICAVERRRAHQKIPKPVNRDTERLGPERHAFGSPGGDEVCAARQSIPDETSFLSSRTGPDFPDYVRIFFCERAVADRRADKSL